MNAPPPDLVWHYTDFDALDSILRTGVMRASSLLYLNDSSEFQHTLDVAKSVIEKVDRLIEVEGCPDAARFYRDLVINSNRISPGNFVTCFSTEPDDLSQWRAYGQQIPSFSIGFDKAALVNALSNEQMSFDQCEYRADVQEASVREVIERNLSKYPGATKAWDGNMTIDVFDKSWRDVSKEIADLAVTFKAPQFKPESEWRAIYPKVRNKYGMGSHPHKFRRSGGLIVPFREWKLWQQDDKEKPIHPIPIRHVIVGPGPHIDKVVEVVRSMAFVCGMGGIGVSPSVTKHRNW